jgi:DNA-binding IclR family transcriptional regulator
VSHDALSDEVSALVVRAQGEYLEMPGLRLAAEQAARLWAVDRHTSERILAGLVRTGFLWRTPDGFYVRPSIG